MTHACRFLSLLTIGLLAGCASYMTPGGPASIPEITQPQIAQALRREPAAPFPSQLIVARVQASAYVSASSRGYGEGRFSVVTARDVETETDLMRLGAMPGVIAVGPLSRLVLPSRLDNAENLREAAAQLHGDILLLYTMDTAFHTDTQRIGPLQLVSLGFFPNKKSQVTATCSAAFVDVRTGYIYGIVEGTATESQRSDLWNTGNAIETARRKAERAAFEAALAEIEKTWAAIHARYSGR